MKKKLFVLLIAAICLFPLNVVKASEPVTAYFFFRDSCPFCVEFKSFLDTKLEAAYKAKINIEIIDVENNSENVELMLTIAQTLQTNSGGAVPFMVIGKNPIVGFGGTDEEITALKKFIDEEYNKDVEDRFDIMENLDYTPGNTSTPKDKVKLEGGDIVTIVIMIAVIAGIAGVIFFSKEKDKKKRK